MTLERHARQGLPDIHTHDPEHPVTRSRTVRRARWLTGLALAALALGLGARLFARKLDDETLAARSRDQAVLPVRVTHAAAAGQNARLVLPGTLQAVKEAQLQARATGYVRQWTHDIGSPVRRGEVLATLDIPEVARQVDEAAATEALARTEYERWKKLRAQDAVPQQELDEKTGAWRLASATLSRLREELGYGQVLAPFDGVVTQRLVNVGDLVTAGASQPLFTVSQLEHLHVYVYVPQDRAAQLHVGDAVLVRQPSQPDQPLKALVARSARAIDLNSRTLQVDIDVPNPDGKLLPGSYVEVEWQPGGGGLLALPTNTLLYGAHGTEVAVVRDGQVQRRQVSLGVDLGQVVEVRTGVTADDAVILNPPDGIGDGQLVKVEAPAASGGAR